MLALVAVLVLETPPRALKQEHEDEVGHVHVREHEDEQEHEQEHEQGRGWWITE